MTKSERNGKKIHDHLEFLGYDILEYTARQEYDIMMVKKDSTILIILAFENMSIVTAQFDDVSKKLAENKDTLLAINELNNDSLIIKWCLKPDEDNYKLTAYSYYYDYSKVSFAWFLDRFNEDLRNQLTKLASKNIF